MSTRIKLAGKLPGDPLINGLDDLADELADRWLARNPADPASVLVIGIARVRNFTVADDGEGVIRTPTVELTRVEPLGVLGQHAIDTLGVASKEHQKILLAAAEARTGATPLPIDAVSVQEVGITVEDDEDDDDFVEDDE